MKALLLTPLASPFLEQPYKLLKEMDPPIEIIPLFYGDRSHRPTWGEMGWVGCQLEGSRQSKRAEIDKIWDKEKPDFVILSQYRNPECLYARKKALKEGIPYYMAFVEPLLPSTLIRNEIKKYLFRRFASEAKGIGVMGKGAMLEYSALYKGPMIDTPYTFDFTKLLSFDDKDRPDDKVVFLYSGRMVGFRDPIGTVKLFAACYRRNPGKVELIISGTGELENDVKNLVHELKIEKGVRWMNEFRDWEDIRNLYRHAHVLLSMGKFSTWNIPISEAMAAGMAIIATRTTEAANSLIIDGYNGFLVNHGDEKTAITAMESLLLNQEEIKVFRNRSRDIIKNYDCCNVAKNLHRFIIESLCFSE
jgi:glycosyltransferase involved in cell wall biosynthesis